MKKSVPCRAKLLLGLSGVLGVDLFQAALQADDLAGLDLDVGRLALEPAGHLVDQDPEFGSAIASFSAPASNSEPMVIATPTQMVASRA